MNKLPFNRLMLGLFAILFITSCRPELSNNDLITKYLPADASTITAFNFKNLMDKADFDEVKKMDFYRETIVRGEKENPALAEILIDPAKSGVDLTKNAYVFAKNDENKKSQIIGGLVLAMANKSTFEKMLVNSKIGEFQTMDDYQFAQPKGNGIVAWNSDMIYIGGANRGTPDLAEVSKLFNKEKNDPVSAVPTFNKAMSGNHDFASWINLDPIVENLPPMAILGAGLAGVSKEDLLGNYMYGYWDFEKGKMKGLLDYDMKKELTKDVSLLFKNKIKTDFSNKIPGENLGSLVTLGLDFKGMNQVLNEKGFLNTVNGKIEETGIKFKDIATAFGGDLALAFYPVKGEKQPDILVTTNIEDIGKAQFFFEIGLQNKSLKKTGKNKYLLINGSKNLNDYIGSSRYRDANGDMIILVKGDLVYLGTNSAQIDLIERGGFKTAANNNKDISDVLGSNVFGIFADFELIDEAMKDMNLNHFKNLKISGNRENASIEMETDDANENSLKTLMKMVNETYKKDKTGIRVEI